MKTKLIALSLIAVMLMASTTFAGGKIISYNRSYKQPVRTLETWNHGPVVTHTVSASYYFRMEGTCAQWVQVAVTHTRTVTYIYGQQISDVTVDSEPTETVVMEFCL